MNYSFSILSHCDTMEHGLINGKNIQDCSLSHLYWWLGILLDSPHPTKQNISSSCFFFTNVKPKVQKTFWNWEKQHFETEKSTILEFSKYLCMGEQEYCHNQLPRPYLCNCVFVLCNCTFVYLCFVYGWSSILLDSLPYPTMPDHIPQYTHFCPNGSQFLPSDCIHFRQ